MITPDYIKPLREHPLFKRYISEYKNCIYRSSTFKQENTISVFVGARVQSHPAPYLYADDTEALIASLPPDEGKTPTADQCAAIAKIFREPLLLILGSAGTGKTTALRLLCRYILTYMIHHRSAVLFLAPTGKAVQRIKDSIANIEFSDTDNTMTVHRFANIVKMDKWFQEIPKIVVIDEAIMVDNEAMFLLVDSLYKLISDDTLMPHIVFIGDDGQLQPVGCGNPIMDLIKSGAVPIHRLQQIHRHNGGSLLLDAVTALREGRAFTSTDNTFRILDITETTLKPIVLKWIDDHPGDMNAVIVPTNHLMNALTPIIREHLNPVCKNPTIKLGAMDYKFRKGDKIMQIKNNYERCVFNGTCGYIVDVIKKTQETTLSDGKRASLLVYNLHVKFNGMKNDYYYTVDDSYKELALAYAFTTHKAQGSEYDHVLIVMDKPIPGFINRNLIYTAASRGKKTVTVGLQQNSIRRQWRDMPVERVTNLVSMIDANVEYEV
jgi:exodeoxyribonuclease V alpha subunit